MQLLKTIKTWFAKPTPPARPIAPLVPEPEADEITLPELTIPALRAALAAPNPPQLLDVRELYEWRQVRIPGDLHIPMNSVPDRLDELNRSRPVVVFCAHGSRSFGVTYFLREQGFAASNLTGGITQWHIQGGPIEQDSFSVRPQ